MTRRFQLLEGGKGTQNTEESPAVQHARDVAVRYIEQQYDTGSTDVELSEALSDLYVSYSQQDARLLQALADLEQNGVLTREEHVALFVLLVSSEAQGRPVQLDLLRSALLNGTTDPRYIAEVIEMLALPVSVTEFLLNRLPFFRTTGEASTPLDSTE